MNSTQYNLLDAKSRIGISVDSDSLEDTSSSKGNYHYLEPFKRLTKANSFLVFDEMFYIGKKDYQGKATKIYHVYRVSDLRLVTSSPHSKDETIMLVKDKYDDYCEVEQKRQQGLF